MTSMVNIQIPMDVLIEAVKMAGITNRLDHLLKECGQVCSRNEAMRQLHVGSEKLDDLIRNGKVRTACEGEKIDVRSIVEYIDMKPSGKRV